jgi:hypothetical protein
LSSFDVIICVSLIRFGRILLQVEAGVKLLSRPEVDWKSSFSVVITSKALS